MERVLMATDLIEGKEYLVRKTFSANSSLFVIEILKVTKMAFCYQMEGNKYWHEISMVGDFWALEDLKPTHLDLPRIKIDTTHG